MTTSVETEEAEILGGEQAASSEGVAYTPSENEEGSDHSKSEQKNSSNWKKMSEAKKKAEFEATQAKNELLQLKEWANSLYEDESQKPFKRETQQEPDKADRLEARLFLIENKEAKEYIDDIQAAKAKFNMDYEDAWSFVQAKLPKESVSKTSFDVKGKSPSIPKDLTKVSAEDALSLPIEERRKWRVANGWDK